MRIAPTLIAFTMALPACSALEEGATLGNGSDNVTGTLFVANKRGDSLSRIDLASGDESTRVETCENPHELSVSPEGAHLALACYAGTSLEIFRTGDLARVAQIELGQRARPHGVVWHENGMLVASAEGRGSIFVVERPLTEQPLVREIGSGGAGPHMVVVDRAGDTAWGSVVSTGSVIRYDLIAGRETARQQLGGDTEAIALSADESTLWVGANSDNRVYRLDPDTLEVRGSAASGAVPIRVAAHPQQDLVVTSNFGDGSLTVIDGAGEVTRTISVSGSQNAAQVTLVFSADGERLYAAETAADEIAEIDFESGEVLRRLPTGSGGDGLTVMN